ncbi:MAG: hypothetical protein JNL32_01070 [Candidatus Kapabacteria bacterium]|nr:hypothetical protein [Candidatus Kapabacteria bacterium]
MNENGSNDGLYVILAFVVVPIIIVFGKKITPDEFTLNDDGRTSHYVRNLSALDSVAPLGNDAMTMAQGTRATFLQPDGTQFKSQFYTAVNGTGGVTFTLRSTENDYKRDSTRGISFTYSTTGSELRENGRLIQRFDTIRAVPGKSERILLENNGRYTMITVGCTRILQLPTQLPATEYVMLRTDAAGGARLSRVNTAPLYSK